MGSAHTRAHGPAGGAAKGAPAGALVVVVVAYGDVRGTEERWLEKVPLWLLSPESVRNCRYERGLELST
jgi:hypothetical protein